MKNILIIDDDQDTLRLLDKFFSKKGFHCDTATNGKSGLEIIRSKQINLVLCDFKLPDTDGLEMIQKIKILDRDCKIIIITGYSDIKIAVEALKLGAYEYVTKPLHPDEILHMAEEAIALSKEKTEEKNNKDTFIIGDSRHAQNVYQQIELIAPTDMSVIIYGETGTGKEFVAKAIHQNSRRKSKPFVALDCGSLPNELAGSEMFGHVKGAFTGALKDKKGCFELADGGTLFLDEIGNLTYENQVKLLRVLQERNVRRIGDDKERPVDVRILVATNESLETAIEKGTFRLDIYHRLNEFKIELQPLRERPEDIKRFAEIYRERSAKNLFKNVHQFTDEAMKILQSYTWHGNLRELKNVVKKSVLLSRSDKIESDILPPELSINNTQYNNFNSNNFNLKEQVEHTERKIIIRALRACEQNKIQAAKLLGVDRKTLYNKMKALKISE